MTGGWLEHEIRSFPQVLSCSITGDDIVVLVQPSADPVALERSISEFLRTRGVDLPVRVFGGTRPVFAEPVRIRNGRPALIGSVGGALVLAAGIWLAGSGVGLRTGANGRSPRGNTELTLAPPVVRELVMVPASSGGEEPTPMEPVAPRPILRPSSVPPLLGGPKAPVAKPPPGQTPGPGPGPGPVEPPVAASCNPPHEGQEVVPKNGQGHGPPAWSHSIHVPAHCDNGRPK
ncbi:MAG: hypothetical protein ACRDKG_06200 [Actinomycetota bacterium]